LTKEAHGARAKINLFLHVTGRRSDGYHLLDSLAVFADVHDAIEAQPSDTLSLTIDGPFGQALAAESDNLVLRAARALAEAAGTRPAAALRLTKNLPVASGIGGGSADAAATLRALSALWNIAIPPALPESLGADVPVCMASRACRMQGIGEILAPAPALPPWASTNFSDRTTCPAAAGRIVDAAVAGFQHLGEHTHDTGGV